LVETYLARWTDLRAAVNRFNETALPLWDCCGKSNTCSEGPSRYWIFGTLFDDCLGDCVEASLASIFGFMAIEWGYAGRVVDQEDCKKFF
jgi:hypothetical protein